MIRILLLLLPVMLFAMDPAVLLAQNPGLLNQFKNDPQMQQRLKAEMGWQENAQQPVKEQTVENNITATFPSKEKNKEISKEYLELDEEEKITKEDTIKDLSPFTYKSNSDQLNEILKEQVQREDQELVRFGDTFLHNHNQLNPAALPVPDNYLINVGDTLSVSLYGQTDKELSLTVNHNGDILLPEIGPVKIAGMPFTETKKKLTDILESAYSNTSAYVDINTFSTLQVTITGHVAAPGIYNLQSFSTILDGLKMAEGILPTGSMRAVKLKRNGKIITTFDLYELIRHGNTDTNRFLRYGDIIIVPTIQNDITLTGAVRTPGIYELKSGESFAKLMDYAGGITADAKKFGIKVKRFDANSHIKILSLNIDEAKKFTLQKGDSIFIRPITGREAISVTLLGNVVSPGPRTLSKDGTLSSLLQQEVDENGPRGLFLDNTAMHYGMIKRYTNTFDYQLISFDLTAVLTGTEHVALQDNDEIYVFNRYTLKENPYVYVQGDALQKPMKMQFFPNMTLKDVYQNVIFRTENIIDREKERKEALADQADQADLKDSKLRYRVFPDRTHIKVDRQTDKGRSAYIVNLDENPDFTLLPFDEITILDYYSTNPLETVTIEGEVILPGSYAYEPDMTLKKLTDLAGGYTEKTYADSVEIIRYTIVNGERQRNVTTYSLTDTTPEQIKLVAYDEVRFFTIPNWYERQTVTLTGEVKFPGTYTIETGERLASVIARAGGFTSEAFIDGAVFTREKLKEQQQKQLKEQVQRLKQRALYVSNTSEKFGELSANKQNAMAFTEQIAKDADEFVPLGRINITLKYDLQTFAESPSNIILKPDDKLHIPTPNDTVFVFGEVLNASTVIYNPELSVEGYIELCGGLNDMADDEQIYVIRADGTAIKYEQGVFSSPDLIVNKGDTIVIPMKLDYFSGWQMVKDATEIFYRMALSAAALNALSN